MNLKSLFFAFPAIVFNASSLSAQTTYDEVAEIFYSNCTSCHHDGGIAPMSFMNYSETSIWATAIGNSIQGKNGIRMPPFLADTGYTTSGHIPHRFIDEKVITALERSQLLSWISDGALEGDPNSVPAAPQYGERGYGLNGTPDLVLGVGDFISNSNSSRTDPYNCIVVPSSLTEDRWLMAYEIIPGNMEIVHHVTINVDTTGTVLTDTSGTCSSAGGQINLSGWAPGASPIIFPSGASFKSGMRIPAGSNFVFNIHYAPGTGGQLDANTRVRLFFYPKGTTGIRPVYADAMLQEWDLVGLLTSKPSIPADSIRTYRGLSTNFGQARRPQPATAMTILSTAAHSHVICTKIRIFASLAGDTIPIMRINDWNFKWQGFIGYTKPVIIPAGYKLESEHEYDNSTNNPHLEGPPIDVYFGEPTASEMLFDTFIWMHYMPGDENLDLKALIENDPLTSIKINSMEPPNFKTEVFPNPANERVFLTFSKQSNYAVRLLDLRGEVVLEATSFTDNMQLDIQKIVSGMYFLEVQDVNSQVTMVEKLIVSGE